MFTCMNSYWILKYDFFVSVQGYSTKNHYVNMIKIDYAILNKSTHRIALSFVQGKDTPFFTKTIALMNNIPSFNIRLSELPESYTLFLTKAMNSSILQSLRITGDPQVTLTPTDEIQQSLPKQVEILK